MQKIIWIAIVLTLTIPIEARKKIQGTVRDTETGALLANVSIRIYNTQSGTMTDDQGYFVLNLWQLPITVVISHIGYYPQPVVISESSKEEYDIRLTNRTYALQEIVVRPPHPFLRQFTFNGGYDGHWSPDGQHIAFISSRTNNPEVWVKPLSGESPTRYTHNDVWDCSPTWSPNGKHLAFVSEQNGALNIWAMLATGDSLRPITTDRDFIHDGRISKHTRKVVFSWSPNSDAVVFAKRAGDTGRLNFRWLHGIWKKPITGEPATQMTLTGEHYAAPQWSPNGNFLAVTNPNKIQIVNLSDTPPRRQAKSLMRWKGGQYAFSWSPNSKWLAFSGDDKKYDSGSDLWLVRHKDQKVITLSKTTTRNESHPQWSPDGQHIVFSMTPAGYDLWIMPATGGQPIKLAECVESADWSPNGQEIAFVAYTDNGKDIFKMPSKGGEWHPITSKGKVKGLRADLCWSPDGKTLSIISNYSVSNWEEGLDLWTIPAKGGKQKVIKNYSDSYWHAGYRPRWSPDSKQIAFTRYGKITIISTKGQTIENPFKIPKPKQQHNFGRAMNLESEAIEGESQPVWSPNGQYLAFTSTQIHNNKIEQSIWIAPKSAGEARRLTTGSSPEWSPDSSEILFIPEWSPKNPFSTLYKESANKGNSAPRSLYKIAETGGKPVPILENIQGLRGHRWSPDGQFILFLSQPQANLWILNLAGTKFKPYLDKH